MTEEKVTDTQEPAEKTLVTEQSVNPFAESSWTENATVPEQTNLPEDKKEPETKAKDKEEKLTVDADGVLVKETGWKTWDEAKAAKAKLEEFEKAPKVEPTKLSEEGQKWLDVFKEGKEDTLYEYLNKKKSLERAEKLDAAKPKDAAEIIKLDYKYKNPDMDDEDLDFLLAKKYAIPEKPEQDVDQTDEAYEKEIAKWEKKVKTVEREMTIDAKMAKPNLSKYKAEIVLPHTPKAEEAPQGLSQEELADLEKARQSYLQHLDKDFVNFKGFSVEAKDEDVQLPISYGVTDQERKTYKESLQEFDPKEYLQERWFSQDEKSGVVTPKVDQMMADKYLLDNRDKIFQKIANEAAAQMKAFMIKQRSNVVVDGGKNNTNVQRPTATTYEKEVENIWKNG